MNYLTDVYEKIASDTQAELEKLAEEDAAGRIMARGFWDELTKVAQGFAPLPAKQEETLPGGRVSYRTGQTAPAAPKTPQSNVTVGKAKLVGTSPATPKSNVTVGKAQILGTKPFRPSSIGGMMASNKSK